MKSLLTAILVFVLIISRAQPLSDAKQQYASIGNFILENGQVIYDCTIGYRTYGILNAGRSNAIVCPTWFTGTAKDEEGLMAGNLIDTTKYYAILVDALGDGYSSSPGNSTRQPRLQFPVFSIRDMVESQYKMLTEKLNIHHLAAVMGLSMGGMQSFQWAVSHPGFMDKVIPIVGSPQLTSNDLLLWNGELEAMERDTAYHNGNYTGHPAITPVTIIHRLAISSPTYMAENIKRDSFTVWFDAVKTSGGFDWNNWHRQLEAMIKDDVTQPAGGPLEDAAKKVTAKMLIITSKQDHMVNPIPATKFAAMVHAQMLELDNNCGHLAPGCEMDKVLGAVKAFLAE
ncbi:MAG TPA: alpha/beta fold hydrolase [Chitinophagaceae bacterium]|nr:alpha/beta fold hydrolase [Chitinophagaceae bacterium]